MKTKMLSMMSLFLFGTVALFAQDKTASFEVSGNCGMCEKRIEKAAGEVEGVSKADWDKETNKMEVSFDGSQTDADQVQLAIAKVGHDTPKHKAKNEVYDELPGCCQYERTLSEKE